MANHIRRATITWAVLAAGLGLTLTACTTGPTNDGGPATTEFGHVHGLGVDPDSGETYAATHGGVWLLPTAQLPSSYPVVEPSSSGTPRQIAGRAQDTMGFTVARPGLLLGSGHPDPAEQPDLNPPNLGLIASTDRANTWTTISLRGETDFHDLASVELPDGELRIYGYDATAATVKVSDDTGTTWTDGATIELRDLAADAGNSDRVYATTAQGLMVSDDAGGSFTPVGGAPALYLVEVATGSSGLVGIDTEGVIWTSDGTNWARHGSTTGVPGALAYVGGDDAHWLLIADDRGVVATDDYGTTATVLIAGQG